MRTEILFRTAALCMVIIGTLFTGEVLLRILYKEPSLLVPDPVFHHIHNRYFCGRRVSPKGEYNVMVKFNSYGYRDYEYTFKKPEGANRIVILGDSFVDGLEVEMEDTFAKQLEKMLNGIAAKNRYEVINLGMQGYSPILEYLAFKNMGIKFHPDFIIVCFHFTDIPEDYAYSKMMATDIEGLPLRVTPLTLSQKKACLFKDFLRSHSRLYVLARNEYHTMVSRVKKRSASAAVYPSMLEDVAYRAGSQKLNINPYAVFKADYSREDEQAWELAFKYLLGIKSLADKSGSKFILIIIPAPDQVSPYEVREGKKGWLREEDSFISSTKMQEQLLEFCRQNRIDVLDMLPALRDASSPEELLFFVYDGHFNQKGHRVAAHIIYNYLLDRRLIHQ